MNTSKVEFCSWCDDPPNPDPKHHPNGQCEHVIPKTLKEYLASRKDVPKKFVSKPHVVVDLDWANWFFEDCKCYLDASPHSHSVELYRAFDDNRVVGVRIYGVSKIVEAYYDAKLSTNNYGGV